MKATKLLLTYVAAVAMLFVSCGKDNDDNGNNNGGGNTPIDQNNMASVGGLTTPLTYEFNFDDFGTANVHGVYANGDVQVHFGAGIAWETLGKTFDLTAGHVGEDFWFRYEGWAENGCEFRQTRRAAMEAVYRHPALAWQQSVYRHRDTL